MGSALLNRVQCHVFLNCLASCHFNHVLIFFFSLKSYGFLEIDMTTYKNDTWCSVGLSCSCGAAPSPGLSAS